MPVIGFISARSPEDSSHVLVAYRRGLAEGGFIESQNVAIEFRWASRHYDRLSAMAADLVKRRVAVLTTAGGEHRNTWPRFMQARTLMLGCVAGEGHFHHAHAQLFASLITGHARALGAQLIVLKEFPACYRSALDCLLDNGFTRIPSLPMTRPITQASTSI
jgi:hypothetical protein